VYRVFLLVESNPTEILRKVIFPAYVYNTEKLLSGHLLLNIIMCTYTHIGKFVGVRVRTRVSFEVTRRRRRLETRNRCTLRARMWGITRKLGEGKGKTL
jgi:hypothetical protein